MAVQLGSAYGKVSLDVRGLLDGVKQGKAGLMTLVQVGQQVGSSLQKIGAGMTVGLTLPIIAMGAASIKAASDFEETKNKAVVVFGEMADSVVRNSNKSATALGISKTQYLDYASAIGAALTAGGLGIKESAELAEQAVKHFADLASFHNARVEDVAAAWQSAIRGQYEPIQKYFPFITDTYLKTYGVANGLVDENTKTLTANQRAIILNAIALDEQLNPALNDFAETADGLANSTRIMKAQWQDALVLLGQNLLPIALEFVQALNKMLEAFNNLGPVQQKMVLGFAGFLAILGPVLSALGTVITVISSLAGFLGTLGTMGVSLAGVGAGISAVGAAIAAAAVPILVIVAVLVVLALQISLFYFAWKFNWFHIRDIVQLAVANIKSIFAAFKAFLRGDTAQAVAILQEMGQRIRETMEKIFGKEAVDRFIGAFNNFVKFITTALGRVRDYIVNAFSRTDWGQIGKYILYGIANGMLGGLPNLLAVAQRVAASVLAQIKRSLGIASDSKEGIKIGYFLGHGITRGVPMGWDPETIARTISRPVTQFANSQQQNITMHFANGLTTREVAGMIAQNNELLIGQLNRAMGGA